MRLPRLHKALARFVVFIAPFLAAMFYVIFGGGLHNPFNLEPLPDLLEAVLLFFSFGCCVPLAFLIPLAMLIAFLLIPYVWTDILKGHKDIAGSWVMLALSFIPIDFLYFLLTYREWRVSSFLHWDPGSYAWVWPLVFAIPHWTLACDGMVKLMAWYQPEAREKRRLEHEKKQVLALLEKYDAQIERLKQQRETLAKKHEAPLSRKEKLEREIRSLIASDPANLGIKVNEFRKQAQELSSSQLREQDSRVDGDLEEIRRSKQKAKGKLGALEGEGQVLETQRREAEKSLRELEMADPANVGVQLGLLRSGWRGMSPVELGAVKPSSEVGRLFREVMLLNYQIQTNREDQTLLKHEVDDTIAETILLLEKHILEVAGIDRVLRHDEPRLLEIEDRLRELEFERSKLQKEQYREPY